MRCAAVKFFRPSVVRADSLSIARLATIARQLRTADTRLRAAVQLVHPRECDVCIVSSGDGRPKGLKHDAKALRAEWLLAAAETLTAPDITHQHLIAF
jgi:hypothetical protein